MDNVSRLRNEPDVGSSPGELAEITGWLLRWAGATSPVTESGVTNLLGDRLVAVIRSHNTPSVLWHFTADGRSYMLKAEFGPGMTVRNEVSWYRAAAAVGLSRNLYVDGHAGPACSFMVLRYFGDSSTVDDAAIAGRPASELHRHLVSALEMDTALFQRTRRTVSIAAVHGLAVRRFDSRYRQSMAYPYLRQLLTARKLRINGTPMVGLLRCWSRICESAALVGHLTPVESGLTFGDLHCGNILADGPMTEVIDPRGGPLLPIVYDYGKLVQSVEGGYGAVMAGRYRLRRIAKDDYEFTVTTPPGYVAIATLLARHAGDRLYRQSLYQAAQHFAAMLPHHAAAPAETTALGLSSILLFNRLLRLLDD